MRHVVTAVVRYMSKGCRPVEYTCRSVPVCLSGIRCNTLVANTLEAKQVEPKLDWEEPSMHHTQATKGPYWY